MRKTFEVGLARRARCEQHEDERGLVGLIAEAVDAARRHVEEVARVAVDPVVAVGLSFIVPDSTKNASDMARSKCGPGPPPAGAMSTRYSP